MNKYFKVNELNSDTVLLTTNIPYLIESNVSFLLDALVLITTKAKKNIIIDISKIGRIDRTSSILLADTVAELGQNHKSVKFVVSKKKPIITYSLGDEISKLDVYLSQAEALGYRIN